MNRILECCGRLDVRLLEAYNQSPAAHGFPLCAGLNKCIRTPKMKGICASEFANIWGLATSGLQQVQSVADSCRLSKTKVRIRNPLIRFKTLIPETEARHPKLSALISFQILSPRPQAEPSGT